MTTNQVYLPIKKLVSLGIIDFMPKNNTTCRISIPKLLCNYRDDYENSTTQSKVSKKRKNMMTDEDSIPEKRQKCDQTTLQQNPRKNAKKTDIYYIKDNCILEYDIIWKNDPEILDREGVRKVCIDYVKTLNYKYKYHLYVDRGKRHLGTIYNYYIRDNKMDMEIKWDGQRYKSLNEWISQITKEGYVSDENKYLARNINVTFYDGTKKRNICDILTPEVLHLYMKPLHHETHIDASTSKYYVIYSKKKRW